MFVSILALALAESVVQGMNAFVAAPLECSQQFWHAEASSRVLASHGICAVCHRRAREKLTATLTHRCLDCSPLLVDARVDDIEARLLFEARLLAASGGGPLLGGRAHRRLGVFGSSSAEKGPDGRLLLARGGVHGLGLGRLAGACHALIGRENLCAPGNERRLPNICMKTKHQ